MIPLTPLEERQLNNLMLQQAEIDRLRAENQRLRAACDGVPEMLDDAASNAEYMIPDASVWAAIRAKAAALRATLASAERDGAGTAAGDATDGDGDGGAE